MPILDREIDLFPENLLDSAFPDASRENQWWAAYTLARREKDLMRRLHNDRVAFYGPIVEHRYRSNSGRVRVSYKPLFPNYVFVYGTEEDRVKALKSNCITSLVEIHDAEKFCADLQAVRILIESGLPVTLEEKLSAGRWVRIKSGTLKGQEGFIIERRGEHRLVVAIDFLQQGASVLMNDFEVESIDS